MNRDQFLGKFQKSSWGFLIGELKKGVAFLGAPHLGDLSYKKLDEVAEDKTYYVDRKYCGGVASLKLNVLNEDGTIKHISNLSKSGSVYIYKNIIFVIEQDTDWVIGYKILGEVK